MKNSLNVFWNDYLITNKEYQETFKKFKFKYKMLLIVMTLVAIYLFYIIQNNTLNIFVLAIIDWLIAGIVMGLIKNKFKIKDLYKEIKKN